MKIAKLACVFLVVCWTVAALAQTLERGAVHGTVYDPTHATIPNTKVTLSNPSTGFRREMTTSSDGGYDFESVPPGQYTIVAEAGGFAVTTITGIVVNVGMLVPTVVVVSNRAAPWPPPQPEAK